MVSLHLNPLDVRVGGWEGSSHIDYGLSTSKAVTGPSLEDIFETMTNNYQLLLRNLSYITCYHMNK